jgi:hypothetical protein
MKWLGARPPDSLEYNIKPKEVLPRGVATWATGAFDPVGYLCPKKKEVRTTKPIYIMY